MDNTSKELKVILYCFIISFLFLMICSKSSFLYPLNVWADANCFFTVGKGMFKGKILYASLFDQKGPLLFLYYGIASLISYKTFIGVFFLEVISFTVFLYFVYKTFKIYLNRTASLVMLPVISFIILTLRAFTHGGSAEEFVLPMLMYSLYSLIRFVKSPDLNYNFWFFFINGLMAGLVLTIKFTFLGFWFAFMLGLFIYFVWKKQWKTGIFSGLTFLLGMFIPVIPWLIYFGINNALNDFFNSYVLFNILYYPSRGSLLYKLFGVLFKPLRFLFLNLNFGIPFAIGMLSIVFEDKLFKDKFGKIMIIFTYLFLCFGVFFGGVSFRYYYLILTPFVIFGLIRIGFGLNFKMINKVSYTVLVIILVFLSLFISKNTYMLHPQYKKENLVQYKFGAIIERKKNASLLNYGFLDGGFYTVTGILPNIRYFQKQNVPYDVFPDIIDSQNEVIKNKKVDFVVTRIKGSKKKPKWMTPYLEKNYKVVLSMRQKYENRKFIYVLWQKK